MAVAEDQAKRRGPQPPKADGRAALIAAAQKQAQRETNV